MGYRYDKVQIKVPIDTAEAVSEILSWDSFSFGDTFKIFEGYDVKNTCLEQIEEIMCDGECDWELWSIGEDGEVMHIHQNHQNHENILPLP